MKTLNKIQHELKAPKGQMNAFGGFKYRSCEDILEAVKPLLGFAILTISDEMVQIGDRYYIKATASLTEGDSTISTTAYAREPESKTKMDEAQITGASSSYARKYALNGLFLIDDTKDADTTNIGNEKGYDYPTYKAPKESKHEADFMVQLEPTDEELILAQERLESAKDAKDLKKIWETLTPMVKEKLEKVKNDLKFQLT